MNCLLYTQRTTLTTEADGTTMIKAISVEDYKSKSVIMVAESSGYGMNRVVIDLSQSQGTLGVPRGKNSGPSPQGSGHVPVPPMKNSGPSPQESGHVPVPPMKNSGPSPQGSGHVPVPPVEFH
nr:probable E3 ubiquitin-protein ligase RNF144A-B [Ipomoea batatas]